MHTVQVLFKQFFATAVMGLGHGLILLPVLLSLIGPASYRYASPYLRTLWFFAGIRCVASCQRGLYFALGCTRTLYFDPKAWDVLKSVRAGSASVLCLPG